ncbi:hypothetical protein BX616_011107 [Lobosporangium transversale]|uniref:Uncharacterized protein n=1 Tax=Lobosporangium transversale TaxID=64571 RepID=A0A1Y2GF01_9FUNG|nr:hypothetical protein BCR41DRAFT_358798 [Lobosporangium transversale]KAF9909658.1 hypothetical protein BX616_011107 [Lobosporangium transversale]ORZ09048.1 hypothetical protein BCR41DRAFT_358798 [Lobosporangium transversale]|eukprot:XP_021878675.1 hypothetical protein BCR41DRAFT_358798 [Lobosporangium transversale]
MFINSARGNNRSGHGSTSYHRRSISCVTSHDDLALYPVGAIEEETTTTIATNGDSPAPRMESNGSMAQRSGDNADDANSIGAGSLGGKIKLTPGAPGPRRSLLSDMLNSQNQSTSRLEQNAHRRRMLKSMRRYSIDASEMNFNIVGLYPSGRASPMKGIPSEGEEPATADSGATAGGDGGNGGGVRTAQDFRDIPTVRYLRNPIQATVKTKLIQGSVRRGAGGDNEAPDYFGTEDRVW